MRATVTQLDIKRGKRGSCGWCPIARALRRELGYAVFVYGDSFSMAKAGNTFQDLPKSCNDFVGLFDNNEPVKPFSFRFRKPKLRTRKPI